MKKMGMRIKSLKEETKMFFRKLSLAVSSCVTILATASSTAYAAPSSPADVVKACIDVVVNIFPYVGAFFVVAGVFKLIMAYRNDQPEAQAGAAKDIVIGAVFIVFKVFVWDNIKGTIF